MQNGITLLTTPLATVTRSGRHLHAQLQVPASVLSTSHVNGGLRRDLRHLVNHQSCEPVKHQERFELITGLGQDAYHGHVCAELGLDPAVTALMGTAAAMQYLGIITETYEDLSVTAIVTAGVTGNAGSAGDAALYDERDGKWQRTPPAPAPTTTPTQASAPTSTPTTALAQETPVKPAGTHGGTINTLVLISCPLSEAALTRSLVTITEAKSAALVELAVGSRYSARLATGTGTDQYLIAAPLEGVGRRTWAGKHTKLGELLGLAVSKATKEALRWQNGLEPSYTRSLFHALGRFGLSEERLKADMEKRLPARAYQLFKDNWNPVCYEPQLAAAAFAFAAVLDRIAAGTLGPSSAAEALLNQAALMAAGLACAPEAFPALRRQLEPRFRLSPAGINASAAELALDAIALGFQSKWNEPARQA